MSIYSRMKDMVIIVDWPLFPPDAGELLEEQADMLTTARATVSCIDCEPTPHSRVQGATNVVTCGPPILWLFYFGGCGLGIIIFLDLKIICQVWSKPSFGNFT